MLVTKVVVLVFSLLSFFLSLANCYDIVMPHLCDAFFVFICAYFCVQLTQLLNTFNPSPQIIICMIRGETHY